MKNILCVLLLILVAGLHAHATPLDDKIKAFGDALKATSPANSGDPMFAERMTQQLDASTMPGQEVNLEATVRQLMLSNPSKAVQQAGQALLDELQARKKARLAELTAKVDAAVAPVPDAVAKAEKPVDLDPVLDALLRATPANGNMYGYDPDTQTQNARVTSTYQFVSQWQDYLSYRDTKNFQQELNTLRNLLNNRPGQEPIIPRSEILTRIAPLEAQEQARNIPRPYMQAAPPDLAPILDGVKTIDDLEPAMRQLALLPNSQMQNYDTAELSQLAFLYGQAQNGLPITLDLNPQYINGTAQPGLARIEAMVLLYVLPRVLGPGAPAPNTNEQVDDYLTRAMTVAETAQNWELVQRILNTQMKIAKVQPQMFQGTQNFLAGLSQEIARQYSSAVTDYQHALSSPDAYTPSAIIGDRLAAIKKDHPADYAGGMQAFLHPPAPVFPAGYPNPYMMRYGMPGYTTPLVPASLPPIRVATPAAVTPAPAPAPATNAPPANPPSTK